VALAKWRGPLIDMGVMRGVGKYTIRRNLRIIVSCYGD